MIPLLLATSFTCADIKELVYDVRRHENLSDNIRQEIIVELLLVAPPGCKDLQTELGG